MLDSCGMLAGEPKAVTSLLEAIILLIHLGRQLIRAKTQGYISEMNVEMLTSNPRFTEQSLLSHLVLKRKNTEVPAGHR